MTDEFLAEQFEADRERLFRIAYRMLGTVTDADDAIQETWLRLGRTDAAVIDNLAGWLTTVTGRVCLNMLRARRSRREEPLDAHVPDPVVQRADSGDPEHEAVLADSVGLALLVVLDTLAPAERLAFVLHDVFAVPFDEIAMMVDRTPEATRKLASRARRRVQSMTVADPDRARQRAVVDAFFAASRSGDMYQLIAVLHPDVVLRSDGGAARPLASAVVRGAANVGGRAMMFAQPDAVLLPVLINGGAGVVVTIHGEPVSVMGFTVVAGRITAIDALTDPDRIHQLDLRAEIARL
jgi:RNA polymerase sigma factor (sigma-70 family)